MPRFTDGRVPWWRTVPRLYRLVTGAIIALTVGIGCDGQFERWHSISPTSAILSVGDTIMLTLGHHTGPDVVETLEPAGEWRSINSTVADIESSNESAMLIGRQAGVTWVEVTVGDFDGYLPVLVTPPRNSPTNGPLRRSSTVPRYFVDAAGDPVYLAGSHTWGNLQDNGLSDPPDAFDYTAYLDFLRRHNMNFFRLWVWEQAAWVTAVEDDYYVAPLPFLRIGPDNALDGKPRFDLTRFNEEYFTRLRDRIDEARRRGIYVAVMLFNGWSVEQKGEEVNNPWRGHPFHRDNNINGIDGDPDRSGHGRAVHTLAIPAVTAIQEAYVRRAVDATVGLDNVLFEISNESESGSTAWQYAMIRLIQELEQTSGQQRPVGMTSQWPGGSNAAVISSPADWMSPRWEGGSPLFAEAAAGKIIVADTDHICGVCLDQAWVWESFLRGLNILYMDPYDQRAIGFGALDADVGPGDPSWNVTRKNIGYTRFFADRLNLVSFRPQGYLASTGHCLSTMPSAEPEYLVYFPTGAPGWVDLPPVTNPLAVEWFDPQTGERRMGDSVSGGARTDFSPPWRHDAVLYLH